MKITFILPNLALTGGVRVVAIYAAALQERGHNVKVFTPKPAPFSTRQIIRSIISGNGWPKIIRGETHFDNSNVECIELTKIGPMLDEDLPDSDVVIATWWETAEWVAKLSQEKGLKIHFMQDYEIWGGSVERVNATCKYDIPKIVIAQWTYNLLRDKFGQLPIALIPNSVDHTKFNAKPREKRKIPTVGFVYTTFINKGCDLILKAIDIAKKRIPDIQVIAFGHEKINSNLRLPVNSNYYFRAPNDKLKDIYSNADVWLFGTRVEGFGLPILEAMACRTPVVGTPAGAAPEILEKGGGLLIQHEDPQAMADAIVKILELSPKDWKKLSEEAYKISYTNTWEDSIDQFEKAINKVCIDSAYSIKK
jgi:glycosyltransferase involved in cell wall biosynthesis